MTDSDNAHIKAAQVARRVVRVPRVVCRIYRPDRAEMCGGHSWRCSVPPESFDISTVLPAKPERVYAAWLDGAQHAAFTGTAASGEATVGTRFTAWDGYIEGVNIELRPNALIVQRWRTTEFPAGSADSTVTVVLEPVGEASTRLTLSHTGIPEGQAESYRQGWVDYYFEPMRRYFADE